MKVRFLSIAGVEFADALAWYRQRSPRAAEGFWLKVQEARRSIALFPLAAPLIAGRVRRFVLSGYPYDLIYAVTTDEIVILAIAHHSRQPGYWLERVEQQH